MLVSCGTKGLEYVEINEDEYGVKCGEAINEDKIVIPKKHNGRTVTTILKSGFSGCEKMTEITIPKSIVKIETGAFLNCKSLEKVKYGGKIKDWCNIDFAHSTSNPMSMGDSFYAKGKQHTALTISGTEKINKYAFFGFKQLTSVVVEGDVTFIGESAFAGCTSLTSITLPNSIDTLSNFLFSNCVSLKEITVPASVRLINPRTFYGCIELKSIAFENTENWQYAPKPDTVNGTLVDVTDTAKNAQKFVNLETKYLNKK